MHRLCRLCQPAGHATNFEHHLQMVRLRRPDHVEHEISPKSFNSIDHACEVARRVHEGTCLAFRDHRQRVAIAVLEAGREHHRCAVGLDHQALLFEPLVNPLHQRLVLAFAGQVVVRQQHTELVVNTVKIVVGHLDQTTPKHQRVFVIALQQHDAGPSTFLKWFRVLKLGVRLLVEAIKIALRQSFGRHIFAKIKKMLDEHAERPPPVADVIFPRHGVADEFHHPHE